MKNRLLGIILSLLLSTVVLLIFFGRIIRDPGNSYFSSSGDGFKAYYCALYHVKYDTVDAITGGMNYPFGELTAFTDGQPLISNTLRFLDRFFPVSGETVVGAINGAMLLSFVLGALFLFLIMADLGVSWWFAGVAAVGMAMMSPQVARFGGHYSLSWLVWIPALLFWIMRFDKTRSFWYSLLIGLTTFMAAKMHLYFLGFAGFLTGGYWLWRLLPYRKEGGNLAYDLLHFSLQFLIPVILLQTGILILDEVTDRTAYPYGFDIYLGHPAAVFIPSGKPWSFVPKIVTVFNHISWESLAYAGTPAVAGILVTFYFFIKGRFRFRQAGNGEGRSIMTVFGVIAVVALIFSFGVPFVFGLEELANKIGPVRQLRALGRFAWLFYYVVNLLVFTALFRKAFRQPASLLWKTVAGVALILLFYEGYWNMAGNTRTLYNRIEALEDHGNTSEENSWVKAVHPEAFRAIIPVPYFHVGSESIWIDGGHQSRESAMLVSLKTGLPTTGVELSRTSIGQTFINYSLFTEPLQRMELADHLSGEMPFLVMRMNGYEPSAAEQWLLRDAATVVVSPKFTLLSLPLEAIRNFHESWRRNILSQYNQDSLFTRDGYQLSDSLSWFKVRNYDDLPSAGSFRGPGAFAFPAGKWAVAWADTLRNLPAGKNLVVGFWIRDYRKDAFLRTNLELFQKNSQTGETTNYIYTDLFRHLKAFRDEWALVELEFTTKTDHEFVQLSLLNRVLPQAGFILDELLVREKAVDVWSREENFLYKNGRKFDYRNP